MRGKIIAEPWIDLILDGVKMDKFRQTIPLIRKGSGRIVGMARLIDVLGPMTHAQLAAHEGKHGVPSEMLAHFFRPTGAYAWVLESAVRLPTPAAYEHPSGAIIWVTLRDGHYTIRSGSVSSLTEQTGATW